METAALPQAVPAAQIRPVAARRSARLHQGGSGHDAYDSLSDREKKNKQKEELLELMLNEMTNSALLNKLNAQRVSQGKEPYPKRHPDFVETLKKHLRQGTDWRVIKKPKKKQDEERLLLFTQVKRLLEDKPHLTFRDLAGQVGCSTATIHKMMKEHGYTKKAPRVKPMLTPAGKRKRVDFAQNILKNCGGLKRRLWLDEKWFYTSVEMKEWSRGKKGKKRNELDKDNTEPVNQRHYHGRKGGVHDTGKVMFVSVVSGHKTYLLCHRGRRSSS